MHDPTLDANILALEKELVHLRQVPHAEIPENHRCFEDTVEEFNEFNSLDWDNLSTRDIARLSDPYIMMSNESFFFLLPKFFKAIEYEGRKSELAGTTLDMILRDLKSRAREPSSLSPRQIRLIYNIACVLEESVFGTRENSIADEFIEMMLDSNR